MGILNGSHADQYTSSEDGVHCATAGIGLCRVKADFGDYQANIKNIKLGGDSAHTFNPSILEVLGVQEGGEGEEGNLWR